MRIGTLPGVRPLAEWKRIALAFAVALCWMATPALARGTPDGLPDVALGTLPQEARETMQRIRAGGPFPFERDGVRFGNRERLLPAKPRDYYREYTVRTPGARTRGARRIVCGGPATAPDACYYTQDHYQSFARIRE
jgi:ribonuclease T1